MQTAPSAITGFTAAASGGKLPLKNEDQRDDTAGFAMSLRSAMPQEDKPQTPAQLAAEPAKPKATDTTDTTQDSEASDTSEVGKIKRNHVPRNEQILARALKANTKNPSGVSAAALRLPLAVDDKAVNAKLSGVEQELAEGLPQDFTEMKPTRAEEATNADETAAVRGQPASEAKVDAWMTPNRPAHESLEQHDSHTAALADTDPGDSPPLRESLAPSSTNSTTVASNASELGTEVTEPQSIRESTSVPADQKPSSPQVASPASAAVVPTSATGISQAKTSTEPASTAISSQPIANQSIGTSAATNGPAQAKTVGTEPQKAVVGQAPSKARTTSAAALTQEKSLEASLANGPASRSAQSQSNVSGKARPASHHKSRSRLKTGYRAGEASVAKAKSGSVTKAKGDALTLKQSVTGSASLTEPGTDRVALAGSSSASKSSATSSDLAASLAHLPDIDAPLDPADVSEAFQGQLGERLVMAVRNDMSRAEIRINPNELGPITIELHIDGNTTAISFGAENNSTRIALQDSLPSLRDQLAREGLTLGEASVGGQSNRSSDQKDREQQSTQWTELRSDSSELAEEHALPNGYRPPPPARGLVDLFA